MGENERDQQDGAPAPEEKQKQAQQHRVFTVADIAAVGHTVRKRWVTVPEWGGREVCMWGTTGAETARIADECGVAMDNPTKFTHVRRTATVLYCARDGDGADAKLIFSHSEWAWLLAQPDSVMDTLHNAVQELNMSSGITAEQIVDFFAMVGSLKSCLTNIASHCDACTDCPENSRMTCPQLLLGSLLRQTE